MTCSFDWEPLDAVEELLPPWPPVAEAFPPVADDVWVCPCVLLLDEFEVLVLLLALLLVLFAFDELLFVFVFVELLFAAEFAEFVAVFTAVGFAVTPTVTGVDTVTGFDTGVDIGAGCTGFAQKGFDCADARAHDRSSITKNVFISASREIWPVLFLSGPVSLPCYIPAAAANAFGFSVVAIVGYVSV